MEAQRVWGTNSCRIYAKVGMKDKEEQARFLNDEQPKLTLTDIGRKRIWRAWGHPQNHWEGVVAQQHTAGTFQPDQGSHVCVCVCVCVLWG